jgi:cytochrome c oxidase assembly protein subunit 15
MPTEPSSTEHPVAYRTIHRVAIVLCVLTFGLIVWGGHVNTTRSGMAFPDWPTSNLAPMVTYTPSEWLWAKDKFWEHGHRLFAGFVGLVTTLLLVLTLRATPRDQRPHTGIGLVIAVVFGTVATAILGFNDMPSGIMETFMAVLAALLVTFMTIALRAQHHRRVVWLSIAAFVGVCLQGSFGGYTVRNNLPDWTSTTHGVLAEIFFMMIIGITLLTSRSWQEVRSSWNPSTTLQRLVTATWTITLVQFFLGALTRHMDAWGVSITWPHWSDEGFFPSHDVWQQAQVVVHFLHRSTAYVVALFIAAQAIMLRHAPVARLRRLGAAVALLVVLQIALGAGILWTFRGELVTTLHVMIGVVILVSNAVIMFSVRRLSHRMSPAVLASFAQQGGH